MECAYCRLKLPSSVVQCATCERWFCNAPSPQGSHLVSHLVRSRHRVVRLHEQLPLGAETLECYNCGSQNIFTLGFVSAKQDSVMVLLCRMPCAQLPSPLWDTAEWLLLIAQRRLLEWVAPAEGAAIAVPPQKIEELELEWNPARGAEVAELAPVALRYDSGYDYQNAWAPLVNAVMETERALKANVELPRLAVRWSGALATFAPAAYESGIFLPGDEMLLAHECGWLATGVVKTAGRELVLEVAEQLLRPADGAGYSAQYVFRPSAYLRMQQALRSFAVSERSVLAYLYHRLLGHNTAPVRFETAVPAELDVPGLLPLNALQRRAVGQVLQEPLALIQGPPGTGKTVTATAIVHHLVRLRGERVLVCAPLNVAVTHLAQKIHVTGLRVVRVVAKLRQDLEPADSLALHRLAAHADDPDEEEKRLFAEAQVVCCTCVTARVRQMKQRFRTVLVDELTQASEPETMIPITKGAKQVILIGDHKQLGPVVTNRAALKAGLLQLLFERLVALGHVPVRLEVQYRMHPALAEFSNIAFYEGSLQNGVSAAQRNGKTSIPWPARNVPTMFWDTQGREEIGDYGVSTLNQTEAVNVGQIVERLRADGVAADEIGVVTPYRAQSMYIERFLEMRNLSVEVASVDGFQGREKEYIVFSCVRLNPDRSLGFLWDPRRLNVAITRAKLGLVIIGNARTVSSNQLWRRLLVHYRERGCLVTGPLDALQLSMVLLEEPKLMHKETNEHQSAAMDISEWEEVTKLTAELNL